MRARVIAVLLLLLPPLAACSEQGGDELQVVENPRAAVAPASPPASVEPSGRVLSAPGAVNALATDAASRTLAVSVTEPAAVLLYDLDRLDARARSVSLPAPAQDLTVSGDSLLAALPDAGQLARIRLPDGELTTVPVAGGPAGVAADGERTLVALRERKGVAVLRGDRVGETITDGLYSADDVLVADGAAVVLDRKRTALFSIDVAEGHIGEGLRAGQGATNAVADSYGRVFVVDTRRGALLAFSADPLLLRQRYPVPGGAYGIAYDSRRDLVWVTLTRRNEVVAFDVRGGEPREKYRYPTVRQPNSVTVDERTSRVVIGSAAGEGIQVIAL
ncbi:hypothetical protein FHU38_002421 [Saccharomonospora amisosensis]|uniref:Lipoprotein n=1 Tax=Saccharomonospora amisosensis TaxID=1128677 RepID=A0A7X5UQ02_9PSEU|nr:hypothetical protein [Saccharomonospora amisosensis]NIJ12077.1 hypothetical protein [Saccharomonospora amisosensis]